MAKNSTIALGKARIGKNKRVYAVGDIHGCLRELKKLWKLIKADLKDRPVDKHRIIFIGDYVDRGPECKAVIDQLIKWRDDGEKVTFLCGNHDARFIKMATDISERTVSGFTGYGGLDTLSSYGLSAKSFYRTLGENPKSKHYEKLADRVKRHLGKDHLKFLKGLKTSTTEGDYFFCHAGVDPTKDLAKQDDFNLIWIREPFLSWDKPLQKVIVHGHTYCDEPEALHHRINVDTGCVYGGKMTAVVLEGKSHHFLQVKAKTDYTDKN